MHMRMYDPCFKGHMRRINENQGTCVGIKSPTSEAGLLDANS
jgi:hypothetical protein